jgi:mxaA protein
MINIIKKWLIIVLLSLFSVASYAETTASTTVDRAWGLLLGDEVKATATITELQNSLDFNSLPQTEKRYGTWLYLKTLEMVDDKLEFTYQVVNVPKTNTAIELPLYEISDEKGNIITIPTTTISIGPLLSLKEGEQLQLKADHAPVLLSVDEFEQQLETAITAASILSLILLFWHFGWKPRNRQPFAQAVHELSRLRWQRSKDANQPARILHAAFNQTAGTIVVHKELDQLYTSTPWLSSLESDIDKFYQLSSGHFFSREAGQEPDMVDVVKLAKACRAKEKLA